MLHYKDIKIGQKFRFNDQTWQKVKPVKQNCCRVKYNAVCTTKKGTRTFKPLDKVEKA